MNRLIIFIFMIIAFSCTKGSQQENCEVDHGQLGDEKRCLMLYGVIESQKKQSANPNGIRVFEVMLLDCLIHNKGLRKCRKKPDYLPAW